MTSPELPGWEWRDDGLGWAEIVETDPATPLADGIQARAFTASPAVHGVDVAHYQAYPHWQAVHDAGIQFAYVKASEGASTSYSTLDGQYHGARSAGLAVGLYAYAEPNLTPESIADALSVQVNRLGAVDGHLPPCLDLEEGSGNLAGWAQAFIARLRARTGCRRVMVYSGSAFFQAHIGEGWMDPDIALWIAHYGRPPGQPGYLTPRVAIHQYSSTGTVPGIAGNVDLNQAIWPLAQLVTTAEEDDMQTINQGTWEETGVGVHQHITCPVGPRFAYKSGWLSLSTGWADATDVTVWFIGSANPTTPAYLRTDGPFVLTEDVRRPLWIEPGTEAISVQYTAANPVGWSLELFA